MTDRPGDNGYSHGALPSTRRLPAWLRRPVAHTGEVARVASMLHELELNTVCESAKCPNRGECFGEGTATFLIMGDACTRDCGFCAVGHHVPEPLDPDEPRRVAEAAARMRLTHVVITSVTRDDLTDGGAEHFARVVTAVRTAVPEAAVEVLTSDFGGKMESVDVVAAARPNVFNHNVETVPRLYGVVRPQAEYDVSLKVLERGALCGVPTKSGLMVGLGERPEEVLSVMDDLRAHGVSTLTLGQYLRPSPSHIPVAEFVEPDTFARYAREAYRRGFTAVASAPFVRSSYHAGVLAAEAAGCGSATTKTR